MSKKEKHINDNVEEKKSTLSVIKEISIYILIIIYKPKKKNFDEKLRIGHFDILMVLLLKHQNLREFRFLNLSITFFTAVVFPARNVRITLSNAEL